MEFWTARFPALPWPTSIRPVFTTVSEQTPRLSAAFGISLLGNYNTTKNEKNKMEDEAVGAADNIVTEFVSYEDFLDSQITPLDLFYLEVKVNWCFSNSMNLFYLVKYSYEQSHCTDKNLSVVWD